MAGSGGDGRHAVVANASGWPIDWLLQLDPLVALGTLLTTHTLYAGLIWAIATLILTILLGRFFCGWVCPFGTMHQIVGYLGTRGKTVRQRIAVNQFRRASTIKYYVAIVLLAAAVVVPGSLLTGFLDPIPLVSRSVNLVLLPIADAKTQLFSASQRYYEWGGLIGAIFLAALGLNLFIPRFYCRFVCPLGALLGIFGRFAIWRIGKSQPECSNCNLCQEHCEGGCEPAGRIRTSECVLCMNCLDACHGNEMRFQAQKSAAGETTSPDLTRRGLLLSLASGLVAPPLLRLGAPLGSNWNPSVIRPPGSVAEPEFQNRCIRCGQCMRVCPTNVIQPGGFAGGLETLWTPMLNNRIGSSGCQLNCVACGKACPTAAIRRISLEEKLGVGKFARTGQSAWARPSSIAVAACLGRWINLASSARRIARSVRKPFSSAKFSARFAVAYSPSRKSGAIRSRLPRRCHLAANLPGAIIFACFPAGKGLQSPPAPPNPSRCRLEASGRQARARPSKFKSAFNSRTSTFARALAAVSASTNAR